MTTTITHTPTRARALLCDRADQAGRALAELAAGRAVVLQDDTSEPQAVLMLPAEAASKQKLAFMIRHTGGLLTAAMTASALDRLRIPPMTTRHGAPPSDLAVSVDASAEITTGISARDRARTLQVLADPSATPDDLIRPGHVLPRRVAEGGVLERPDHPEAVVDMLHLAGLYPVGAVATLLEDAGGLMSPGKVQDFVAEYRLAALSVSELVTYRRDQQQPTYSDDQELSRCL